MNIIIETGTQKFPFDRLIQSADEMAKEHPEACIMAQIGTSSYVPKHMDYETFIDRDDMNQWVKWADIVLTHGGTGSIISALKNGKHVIAVARLSKYGEHIDDHQKEIIEEFNHDGLIIGLEEFDKDSLWEAVQKAMEQKPVSYPDHSDELIRELEKKVEEC